MDRPASATLLIWTEKPSRLNLKRGFGVGDILCSSRRGRKRELWVYDDERTRSKKESKAGAGGRGSRKSLHGRPRRLSPLFLAGCVSHATDALMDATRTRSERLSPCSPTITFPLSRHSLSSPSPELSPSKGRPFTLSDFGSQPVCHYRVPSPHCSRGTSRRQPSPLTVTFSLPVIGRPLT